MGSLRRLMFGGLVALVSAAVIAGEVSSQESERGDRIIHRYLDPGRWIDSDDVDSSAEAAGGDDAVEPGEDDRRGATHPPAQQGDRPGLWLSPGADEWIWTPEGPTGPGELDQPHGELDGHGGQTQLDGDTDRVDNLDYQASFDPSIIPFKRGGVQDRVRRGSDGEYFAYLQPRRYRSVDVGGTLREGEEEFWGSFLVRIEPDVRHRIPSVAPGQRILAVEAEPDVELHLERDQADNFYVYGDHEGLTRINLRIGVERRYFDGPLDRSVGWHAFDAPADLDDELAELARDVVASIGIDPEQSSPRQVLGDLVEYHRAFEARQVDDVDVGDRYRGITERQVGVCRHRGLTFMISARALGFRTRYVYNEAHAFVEVYWPGQGWRRIDLGGAADDINYQNQRGASIHDGMWDDEFARPDGYDEEMAELAGVDDPSDAEMTEVDRSGESAESAGGLEGSETEDTGEEVELDEIADDVDGFDEFEDVDDFDDGDDGPVVEVLEAEGEVFRGRRLEVRGRVDPAESGDRVEVLLVPTGAQSLDQGVELGRADVDDDGWFEGDWEVPADVSLGRWRVEGRLEGD